VERREDPDPGELGRERASGAGRVPVQAHQARHLAEEPRVRRPHGQWQGVPLESTLKEGISSENAKKIGKIIRDEGPKSVKSQIQGDELRVQSKSRDDLQAVIALLKGSDLDLDLQFINFR
jgi:uncharacterized protein YajQ (UPF0234 family)